MSCAEARGPHYLDTFTGKYVELATKSRVAEKSDKYGSVGAFVEFAVYDFPMIS